MIDKFKNIFIWIVKYQLKYMYRLNSSFIHNSRVSVGFIFALQTSPRQPILRGCCRFFPLKEHQKLVWLLMAAPSRCTTALGYQWKSFKTVVFSFANFVTSDLTPVAGSKATGWPNNVMKGWRLLKDCGWQFHIPQRLVTNTLRHHLFGQNKIQLMAVY